MIEAVGEQETPDDLRRDRAPRDRGQSVLRRRDPAPPRRERRARARRRALGRHVRESWPSTPEGVREVIGRRLSQLGDDCNRMLTIGAAMPGGFTLEVVRRVLDADEDRGARPARRGARPPDPPRAARPVGHLRVQPRADPPDAVRRAEHAAPGPHAPPDRPRSKRCTRRTSTRTSPSSRTTCSRLRPAATSTRRSTTRRAPASGRSASAAHEEAARSYDLALQALELDDDRRRTPARRAAPRARSARTIDAGDADGARDALRAGRRDRPRGSTTPS